MRRHTPHRAPLSQEELEANERAEREAEIEEAREFEEATLTSAHETLAKAGPTKSDAEAARAAIEAVTSAKRR